jgi:hypothetical protein
LPAHTPAGPLEIRDVAVRIPTDLADTSEVDWGMSLQPAG